MYPTERDNITVWNGRKKGWFEIYYLKFNDPAQDVSIWIRYTLLSPYGGKGDPAGELWAVVFDNRDPSRNCAFKKSFTLEQVRISRESFFLNIGGSEITHTSASGMIDDPRTDGISWDLRWTPCEETYRHMPYPIYMLQLPRSKALSPNLSCRFSGRIEVKGRTLEFKSAPGQQSHLWGTKLMHRWAWASCNIFKERDDAVIEAITGNYRIITQMPFFSVYYLRVGQEEYRFQWIKNYWLSDSSCYSFGWKVTAVNGRHLLKFSVKCEPEKMVGVKYRDPDGEIKICNNTGMADIELELLDGSGGRPLHRLTARNVCSFETAKPDPVSGVKVLI